MKTVVIGASPNEARYSNMAVRKLLNYGHEVIALGIRKGKIKDTDIIVEQPKIEGVHTVTIYVGEQRQTDWQDYIINLNPKRIIFNPGTENSNFMEILQGKGINVLRACTLILLDADEF